MASKEIYELADVAMAGMQLLFLSFSREHERESDRLGVEYATKMSYDAHKMADFFAVLEKMSMESSQGGVPTFMSTHPDPQDRFSTVHKLTNEWQNKYPNQSFAVNSKSYLEMIDGIVYGEDPRQGFVENNTFYHPDLKFQFAFPAQWKLVNTPAQVQIIAPDQNAGIIFTLAEENTPEEAAKKVLGDLNLTVLENKQTKVHGKDAIAVVSQQVNQTADGKEQVTKLLSYFIKHNDRVYVFHGISTGEQFNGFVPAFESTMTNFATLTDSEKLNVKPERIKIISIRSASVSVADAFKYYEVPESRFEELALLNNMDLNHELHKGDMIKIIAK